MAKIIYWSWNPYLKLFYMSWNFYRKILNVLHQNLMRMEHFEIYILKLIKKINMFECNRSIEMIYYVLSLSLWSRIHSRNIIKLLQLIWKIENSTKLSPSVPRESRKSYLPMWYEMQVFSESIIIVCLF